MINKTYNAAEAVLSIVEQIDANSGANIQISVEPHVNGREKGFQFSVYASGKKRSAFVYEHRSSDDIVVTLSGTLNNWDFVTEQEYAASKHFQYNEHFKAANFLYEHLCDQMGVEA